MKQLLLDIAPPRPPTLENFIPGRNLELLQTLRKAVTNTNQNPERFIYVWGSAGCGKSHLLQAVAETFVQQQLTAIYVSCEINSEFAFDADSIDCVTIDNVERLGSVAQVRLFNFYNQVREEGNALFLVSGEVPPAQLTLRQDLVTRLGWGLAYQIHELSDEEKREAMRSHAISCGFELSHEICDYLLRHEQRDLPTLIRVVDALDRYSLAKQRQITLPLLRELLQAAS
ncbi:DnaA regulatory inactivator Hda [Nitrosomonas sp. Nm132]|jgi:DnaA family protein|uniref:DnaA regulatory inactivator Hda n=1 Tax=Nitrosomonas sp. Nm132 TaxID=1881053 RepID=UPI000882529E|nr:DnaA regulatory inactivator Hda [Nitrosomonas sp. Nm132]SDI09413.1 regulatory inactivation of DnaA Hda protein [Nitrosomonas sp. Nm132]